MEKSAHTLCNRGILMARDDLEGLPEYPFPHGYKLRSFRPGDEATWVRIHEDADRLQQVTMRTFDEEFGHDVEALKDRCFFLVAPDGRDVGTGTAWYNADYKGKEYGRVHWICIIEEYQGRGLAKPLLAAVMRRLRRSHDRCYLTTSTGRLPAIDLYLGFGFMPVVDSEQDAEAWREVAAVLPHRALEEHRKEPEAPHPNRK